MKSATDVDVVQSLYLCLRMAQGRLDYFSCQCTILLALYLLHTSFFDTRNSWQPVISGLYYLLLRKSFFATESLCG